MADEPVTPQKVTPTVNWASMTQTILMAVIAAVGSVGTYQLSNRQADGIPPAPPAPTITAATLHDEIGELKKQLSELGDKLDSLKSAPAKK